MKKINLTLKLKVQYTVPDLSDCGITYKRFVKEFKSNLERLVKNEYNDGLNGTSICTGFPVFGTPAEVEKHSFTITQTRKFNK